MLVREGSFIDGRWQPSSGDASAVVVNPFTEEPFGRATVATAPDVDKAVRSAQAAFERGEWRNASLEERISVVEGMRHRIAERTDELGGFNTSSMGMPFSASRLLGASVELIDMYIDMARHLKFEYLRRDATGDSLIERRPIGVVAAIVPWNVPVRSEIKKIIPALLSGCSIILKPAPETPFGAAALAEIGTEAGLPPGVLNVVLGDGSTGDHIVRHPLVRKVAFTGSTATGSKIWSAATDTFKRLQLELGGKSAAVVLDDADLEQARPWLNVGIYALSGQACTATTRVLAPRGRYDEVVELMAEEARKHVMGDPFDQATTLGPLVAERQRKRVLGYIEIGENEGGKVVTGGGRPANLATGWFVEPTVFAGVDTSMRIAQEEIFGPVVVVIPYEDDDDAVRIANDSSYGLAGAVYSADPHRALGIARRIDSGSTAINRYGLPSSAPFGGVKNSGIGREQGIEGYDAFLEYIAHPLSAEFAEELAATIPLG
jgi:acyl-CoA reductase-like NAD-dependent aldehyde dehydrogenase